MSAIASPLRNKPSADKPSKNKLPKNKLPESFRLGWPLRFVWLVGAAVCATAMWLLPGTATIPFHLMWIGLSLLYGFTRWRPVELAVMVGVTAAATGAILVSHAAGGRIEWLETLEVPLSVALIAVTAALVRRRHLALLALADAADRDRQVAEARQHLMRQVAHELRTPITVARGFTELIADRHADPETREDSDTVLAELDKLARITQRLVTLIDADGAYVPEALDLPAEVTRIVRRWTPAADREWSWACSAGTVVANRDRLEAVLDCLLDNAVKFTGPGDRIAVRGEADEVAWTITVTDSGPGPTPGGPGTGTSLGLVMARTVVAGWGGDVRLTHEPPTGTTVTLRVPATPPGSR
ncbi:MAG: HAMP domain-containing histidine kinase [Hamadaea sp.]|nr:HAMP domain-containing histidine kinase [Hamadaea sp.]NUR51810.1 HAMP domain-containing histidine kinase [Hamadaea sp.]NUT07269.1 HAMP domain-containing histidine kinase [Hamadaea sp.]